MREPAPDPAEIDVAPPGLPGIRPLAPGDWLRADGDFAGTMALRTHLVATRRDAVLGAVPGAGDAARLALDRVLTELRAMPGYAVSADAVFRPDGGRVPLAADPLEVLALAVQEDVCVMARGAAGAHVLVAAALCFPAEWTLAEKLGRGLPAIHAPVASYDPAIAARVQRLFDGLHPGRPLERSNAHRHDHGRRHAPRREAEPKARASDARWLRRERQCLVGLGPGRGGPALFTIRTYMTPIGGGAMSGRDAAADQPGA